MRRALALFVSVSSIAAAAGCSDDGAMGAAGGGGSAAGGAPGNGGAPTTSQSTGSISLTSTGTGVPPMFTVHGVVVDQSGDPVEGASVLQGGGEEQAITGADGRFELTLTDAIAGVPTPVAAKIGYRSDGLELYDVPDGDITLTLRIINPPDNALGYHFGEPGVGDAGIDNSTLYCGHCHTTLVAQFQQSAHARATRDPLVQDLYAGVASAITSPADCVAAGGTVRDGTTPGSPGTTMPRCYVGNGVLSDLNGCGTAGGPACDDPQLPAPEKPTVFGACADCHGLGMDGPAGGRDLLEAEGVGFENGNHCDACHHVRDVGGLDAPAGNAGRVVMQRPREKVSDDPNAGVRQAIFGPYPDVPNGFMGGSWQPKFRTAEFCSGCHDQTQAALLPGASLASRFSAGLPTHSTYSEWLEGPYSAMGTQCQFCHMPEVDGLFNPVDVSSAQDAGIAGGFERADGEIRSHVFRGPLYKVPASPRLLDQAAFISIETMAIGGDLDVDVTVRNVGCGHAIPTGEPMRALILLVDVTGCGGPFVQTEGMTVPDFGGALAVGHAGADAMFSGASLTWSQGAGAASAGMVVRVVRPTGTYWDYDGIGLFEGGTLSPTEKGIELPTPVGEASVTSVTNDALQLDSALPVADGDIVYLGEPAPLAVTDGDASRALAGRPGMAFARVLVDPDGTRQAPHYRAVDIASDDRIGPLREIVTSHRFSIPAACTDASVHATLLYRPLPRPEARARAWDARDYVATEQTELVTLQ